MSDRDINIESFQRAIKSNEFNKALEIALKLQENHMKEGCSEQQKLYLADFIRKQQDKNDSSYFREIPI